VFVCFWERQFDVILTSVTEAGGTVAGIQNYIDSLFNEDAGLSYLLFVGQAGSGGIPYDMDGFPTYHTYGIRNNTPTMDVYVGAFFVRELSDLENIVYKTIYTEESIEEYPKVQTQFSTFTGSTDHIHRECTVIKDRYWDNSAYTSRWMIPRAGDPNHTFVDDFLRHVNQNESSFLAYQGHGLETSWADGSGRITTVDVEALTNREVFPVVLSHACLTGSFQHGTKSFGEAWTTAEGGAVAFYGASNTSYTYQKMLNAGFAAGMAYQNDLNTLGELFAYAKSFVRDSTHVQQVSGFERVRNVNSAHEKMYNLFGDPALALRHTPVQGITEDISGAHKSFLSDVSSHEGRLMLTFAAPMIKTAELNIYNTLGKKMQTISLPATDEKTVTVTIADFLPAGYYYVRIDSEDSVGNGVTGRFVLP
jgi:hypothetical protein